MIVALIDSGLGLLPTSAWLRRLRPDLDLVLSLDPDGAPWGPKPQSWVIERVLGAVRQSLERGAQVIVIPCNTASVSALPHIRELVGPEVPVVGTVPAIKPAAAVCDSVAIWATAATTASRYQADLIEQFAHGTTVVGVACHGLADSIDLGDRAAALAAIDSAVERTPADVGGVVLGCTHYPLLADEIAARLPAGVTLFDSAEAVARQTLRRIDALGSSVPGSGTVEVFVSGRLGTLPSSAEAFDAGRLLGAVKA